MNTSKMGFRSVSIATAAAVVVSLLVGLTEPAQAAGSAAPAVKADKPVPVRTPSAKGATVRGKVPPSDPTLATPTWPTKAERGTLSLTTQWSKRSGSIRARLTSSASKQVTQRVEVGSVGRATASKSPVVFYSVRPVASAKADPPAGPSPSASPSASPSPTPSPSPSASGPATGAAVPQAPVQVDIDYSDFAEAVGGDWANRLTVSLVDGCDTTKADAVSCDRTSALPTDNDTDRRTLTTTVPSKALRSGSAATLAVAASSEGLSGSFKSSDLDLASSWSAGGQSGDFSWSYPIEVPSGIEGPEPDLDISYSSSAVDGRTSSTNNQVGWIGEGFSLDPGFIERSYATCRDQDDNTTGDDETDDLCWDGQRLSMSFGGKSSPLVRQGSSDTWRLRQDDGTRVERVTGADNGAREGEYWRVTTPDGTRYYFGRNSSTDADATPAASVNTVPVFGNGDGEPCHDSTFAGSRCTQAWRWNIDYVVDPHGSSMSYFYDKETNTYGANDGKTDVSYVRASTLKRIEYGTKAGHEKDGPAPSRVYLDTTGRCVDTGDYTCGSTVTSGSKSHWPDVPYDLICSSSCGDEAATKAPTFFSTRRLVKIRTQVYDAAAGAAKDVDTYDLVQSFPQSGDGSSAALWLKSIQRTGKVGGSVAEPKISFFGTQMPNRVESPDDGAPEFLKWRVNAVDNGAGGVTSVSYRQPECTATNLPSKDSLDTNTKRCFPSRYQAFGELSPKIHFFNKHVVDYVIDSDGTGNAPDVKTTYTYKGEPAWHFDENFVQKSKYRSWNDWRGYNVVGTTTGTGSDATYSEKAYLRGMYGDKRQGTDATKTTTFSYDGTSAIPDYLHYNGFVRGEKTTLGPGGTEVSRTTNTPWRSDVTAEGGGLSARFVDVGSTTTRTRLSDGTFRSSQVDTEYDSYGQPVKVDDVGQVGLAGDEQCTTTSYARNTSGINWLIDLAKEEVTTAKPCGQTPQSADDVISAVRTSYDGGAWGDAPTSGDVTKVQSASGFGSAITYQVDATTTYDDRGRPTKVVDAQDGATTTTYAPATGRPTAVTTKNALGHEATVTVSPERGSTLSATEANGARTDATYDALGRLTKVWNPGRSKAAGKSESVRYSYDYRSDAPSYVKTETLNTAGDYIASFGFYDGLQRELSTQSKSSASNGGRLITNIVYDNRGLARMTMGPYFVSGDPSSTFTLEAGGGSVPSYTETTFDAAGRPTLEKLMSYGEERHRTATTYGGDRVTVKPPTGATTTTTVSDVRGRTTLLKQHTTADPASASKDTAYTYTPAGKLKTLRTPAGQSWSWTYDIRGRMTKSDDPDKGVTTTSYDILDRPVSTTDARGVTLWTKYDVLGRKVELRDDDAQGTRRSSWLYDTLKPGLLTSSTRYTDEGDFTSSVTGYDDAGRPLGSKLMVPESLGPLYKSSGYVTTQSYDADSGTLSNQMLPLTPGLPTDELRWTYDSLDQVKRLVGYTPIVNDTIRDAQGRVLQRALGTSLGPEVYDSFSFDEATGRTTRHWTSLQGSATTPRMDLRYGYNAAGLVTKLNDVAAGDSAQTSASTDRQCFSYDFLQRLTQAWTSSGNACAAPSASTLGSSAPYWDRFGYDDAGNRTSWSRTSVSGSTTKTSSRAYTYGTAASHPNGLSKVVTTGEGAGTESFGVDAVGAMSSRSSSSTAGQVWEWDREGHVKSVTDKAGKKVSFVYDADGNRLLRRDGKAGRTTLTVGITQVTVDDATKAVTSERNYEADGVLVGSRSSGGVNTLQVVDHSGSPVLQVDYKSQAVSKRRFDPFGGLRQSASWSNGREYVNRVKDASVGTTHLLAREYDPGLGRFVSTDPVMDPADPQQLNPYAYANNSPVSKTDPDGLYVDGGVSTNRTAPRTVRHRGKSYAQGASGYGYYQTTSLYGGYKGDGRKAKSLTRAKLKAEKVWSDPKSSEVDRNLALIQFNQLRYLVYEPQLREGEQAAQRKAFLDDLKDTATFGRTRRACSDGVSWGCAASAGLDLAVLAAMVATRRPGSVGARAAGVTNSASDWPKLSGMLRDASKGKGNFTVGSATREQAHAMGMAWVGDGATLSKSGNAWLSADGMRAYRPMSFKESSGAWRANLETRVPGQKTRGPIANAHIDILDPP